MTGEGGTRCGTVRGTPGLFRGISGDLNHHEWEGVSKYHRKRWKVTLRQKIVDGIFDYYCDHN